MGYYANRNARMYALSADGGESWTEQLMTENDIHNAKRESEMFKFSLIIRPLAKGEYVFGGVLHTKD